MIIFKRLVLPVALVLICLVGVFLFTQKHANQDAPVTEIGSDSSLVGDRQVSKEPDAESCHENCTHCSSGKANDEDVPVVQLTTVPEADPVFKAVGAVGSDAAGVQVADGLFGDLKGVQVGEYRSYRLDDIVLSGRVKSVREGVNSSIYALELDGVPGRLVVSYDGNEEFSAHALYYGDSRVLAITEGAPLDDGQAYVLEEKTVSDVFCAPRGAVYTEQGLRNSLASSNAENSPKVLPAAESVIQPALLTSIPGAEFVLYCDFDGEEVDDPWWGTISALPHPRGGDDLFVETVWKRVVEDFAPFNISVTTDRAVYDAADEDKRLHIVITPTDDAFPGSGGVAFISSFRENSPICWVFNLSEYVCATTISHEVGHTMGLFHDGLNDGFTEYYGGHNQSYSPGWGPIMGAPFLDGFYDEVDSWSRGEYANANNQQDDILIIAGSRNGFGFVEDDVADEYDATEGVGLMTVVGDDLVQATGVISRATDVDVYRFATTDGDISFTIEPLDVNSTDGQTGSDTRGANLAVDALLLDSAGSPIMSSVEYGEASLGAQINASVPAGTYYIAVDGVGRGDDASTGFTDYASLGAYTISGQLAIPPLIVENSKGVSIVSGDTNTQAENSTDFEFAYPGYAVINSFHLINNSDSTITDVVVRFGTGDFFSIAKPIQGEIPPNQSIPIDIQYKPSVTGLHYDTVIVEYVSGDSESFEFAVSGTSTPNAITDNYGNNDRSIRAYNLNDVEDVWLSDYKGKAFFKSQKTELFTFTVEELDRLITIDAKYDDSYGEITFQLYSDDNFLTSSTAADGQIRFLIPEDYRDVPKRLTFFIRVVAPDGNRDLVQNTTYDLRWSSISPEAGGDDFYGPNNTQDTAYDLTGAISDRLSEILGKGRLYGDDWYKIEIPSDPYLRMLVITALFDNSEGDINIEVYHEDNPFFFFFYYFYWPYFSASTDQDYEIVTVADFVLLEDFVGEKRRPLANNVVMGVEPGTYYIRVFGDYNGNEYDLLVEQRMDDGYEIVNDLEQSNDAFITPYDLGDSVVGKWLSEVNGPGTLASYRSDPNEPDQIFTTEGEVDYYKFDLPDGETVTQLEFEFRSVGDAPEFVLQAPSGEIIGDSIVDNVVYSADSIIIENPEYRSYVVQVSTWSDIVHLSGYDFRVTTTSDPLPDDSREDDAYEDNDRHYKPYDLTSNRGFWLTSLAGYGVHLNSDWYRIQIPEGATSLEVDCVLGSSDPNLQVTLCRASGAGFYTAEVDGNRRTINWDNPIVGGTYLLVVHNKEGEAERGTTYNLFWDVTVEDDVYEENDEFGASNTPDISNSENTWISKFNGYGIQKDDDWFKFTVEPGMAQLRIRSMFNPDEGDIDMELRNADGYSLARSVSYDAVESIDYINPAAGEYYVKMSYGNQGNEYDLWWAAMTQVEVDQMDSAQDAYEPNDSRASSYALTGTEVRLSGLEGLATQSDDDWYRIDVGDSNYGLILECEFTHANGDIDIELYDADGTVVVRRASLTDNETVNYLTPLPEGQYYIRVYGAGLGNAYDLYWVERSEDALEVNDDKASAVRIDEARGINLSDLHVPVQGSDDWYRVSIEGPNPYLTLELSYSHQGGNIDLEVYDSSDRLVARLDGAVDSESLLEAVTEGEYFIKVYGDNRYNRYDIRWDYYNDDDYEPNNERALAADMTDELGNELNLKQFNDDWYTITVTEEGYFIAVYLSYVHADGNIDMTAYDEFGTVLFTSFTDLTQEQLDDPEYVVTKGFTDEVAPGTYYLQVHGDNTNPHYTLQGDLIADDPYDFFDDGNDFDYNATILPFLESPIDAVQLDDDWYLLYAEPGQVRLFIELNYTHAEGNIGVELYDDFGFLTAVDTDTDDEWLEYGLPYDGIYYLRVHGDNRGTNYTLSWSLTDVDAYETDGGNNTYDTASDVLLEHESTYLSNINGYASSGDEDWYRLQINPDDEAIVVAVDHFLDTLGNIDIELFDSQERRVAFSTGVDVDEERLYYFGEPGEYRLRVYGDLANNSYDLIWNSFKEDALEEWEVSSSTRVENDRSTSANFKEFAEYVLYSNLIQFDDDWYGVTVAEGDDLLAFDCKFDVQRGWIDLILYSADEPGTPIFIGVAYSETADGVTLTANSLPAGQYLLQVYGSSVANEYSLRWISAREDDYEDNDEYATANVGALRIDDELEATQFDDDWFAVEVGAGLSTADLHYIRAGLSTTTYGDLELELYDMDGELVDSAVLTGANNGGDAAVQFYGNGPATYYVRVSGEDIGVSYTLQARDFYDDPYDTIEQNDSFEAAADIIDLKGQSNDLVQYDDDYFKVFVPKDSVHLIVDVAEHGVEGLTVEIYDASRRQLESEGISKSGEQVKIVVPPSASIYYLLLKGNDAGQTYSFTWDTDDVDEYEKNGGNDTAENAYELTPYRLEPVKTNGVIEYEPSGEFLYDDKRIVRDPITNLMYGSASGHATQWDDDWYRLQIPSWKTVRLPSGKTVLRRLFNVRLDVKVFFVNLDGHIELEVFSGEDLTTPIATSTLTDSNTQSVNVPVDPLNEAAVYYIRVYGDNAGNHYTLNWLANAVDGYEGNNFLTESFDLFENEGTWLTEVDGFGAQVTDDWYSIVVSDGSSQLDIECVFYAENFPDIIGSNSVDVHLEVYRLTDTGKLVGDDELVQRTPVLVARLDSGLNLVADPHVDRDAYLIAQSETASIDVSDESGIYYIRVYNSNKGFPYTLRWDDGLAADDSAIIDDYQSDDWAFALNSPELLSPGLNADGDAYANWAEFALGLDSSRADAVVISRSTVEVGEKNYFQFEFVRNREAALKGYTFKVEECSELSFVNANEAQFIRSERIDAATERVFFRSNESIEDSSSSFFRLVVEPPVGGAATLRAE